MKDLLEYLSANYIGIVILIVILFALIGALNWVARIFNWGRYGSEASESDHFKGIAYVLGVFFTNLINDFKHLLALVVFFIFTGLVIFVMLDSSQESPLEGFQVIFSSLGGLLGSIIGYYFGESAARNSGASTVVDYGGSNPNEPDPFKNNASEIVAAPDFSNFDVQEEEEQ